MSVPAWVVDLDSFCRWVESDDVPEKLRIWYLKGEVWIDMSKEEVNTHVLLKSRFFIVLGGLVDAGRLGRFYPDGLFLRNNAADIAGNPDATFVSTAALQAKRSARFAARRAGIVGLEGSADMVLEVVSPSSVRKDTVVLKQAYWEAGVREYWLVDARREPLTFDIFRRTAKGYSRHAQTRRMAQVGGVRQVLSAHPAGRSRTRRRRFHPGSALSGFVPT